MKLTARYTPTKYITVKKKGIFGRESEKRVEVLGEPKRIRIVGFVEHKSSEYYYFTSAIYIKDDGKLDLVNIKLLDEVREEEKK